MGVTLNIFDGQLQFIGGSVSGNTIMPYPNFAAFPAVTSANNGQFAVALDTGIVYEVIGGMWTVVAGPGDILAVGMIDSVSPSANGAVDSNGQLIMQSASISVPGLVNNTTQSFSGQKTFTTGLTGTLTGAASLNILTSAEGVANGVATLDSSGKVPVGQLPSVVMEYQGAWNPNTNTPSLSDGTGTNGNVYYVTALRIAAVSGNTDPSMVNFQIGDLVIYSSSVGKWQLVTPAAGVSSVNGAQGAVTVNAINQLTGDITAGPASGSASAAATLATVNSNIGSFTNASVTVNAKGLVTAASNGTAPVTSLTVATANGLAGSSSGGATPSLTLSTTVNSPVLAGNGTAISAATTTGTGSTVVLNTSPTLVTPALGTPTALVGTNITGTATSFTASNVTTNANLTGDVTSVGNATTLASVATAGTTGSSTAIPVVTINAKGLTTGISTAAVVAPAGTLSGTTLNSTVVSSSLTSVGTIGTGVWNGTTIAIANGGTGQTAKIAAFDALQPMTTGGDLIYGGASGTGTRLANGTAGQALLSAGTTLAPIWTSPQPSPTASTNAAWDSNKNLSANNHIQGYRTQATAASTLTLTVSDAFQQFFTGTTASQILQMPVTSTLVLGMAYLVTNNSTQSITVNSSGSNLILSQASNTSVVYTCILTSGTTAASWFASVIGAGGAVIPTVSTALNSGTGTGTGGFVSGTYTSPANIAYIIVEGVGGGSGGAGSSTVAAGNAGAGGAGGITTFGTSLLTANGGTATGSGGAGYTPGGGGTATITSSATVISLAAVQGSGGQAGTYASGTVTSPPGGNGGASPYGGNGSGGSPASVGSPAIANTGSGGGGGGGSSTTNDITGAGGASGGYFKALIIPTSGQTFSYNVGAAGTAGTGASANAGGAGGLGAIRVTEYYNNGAIGTATTITGNLPTSQITGTTTGNNAASGFIGEYISSNPGSPVTWGSTGVTTNITSISLTAGDWDVSGMIENVWAASSTITLFSGAISKSSGAEDATNGSGVFAYTPGSSGAGTSQWSSLSPRRISIGSTTTIYLVGNNTYTTLSTSNWGINSIIQARRVR